MDKKERKAKRDEEINYFKQQLDNLVKDEKRAQLSFAPTLNAIQRKTLHRYANKLGLKSKSTGKGKKAYIF